MEAIPSDFIFKCMTANYGPPGITEMLLLPFNQSLFASGTNNTSNSDMFQEPQRVRNGGAFQNTITLGDVLLKIINVEKINLAH